MTSLRSKPARRLVLAFALAGTSAFGTAQEKTAPAPTAPPAEDAIAAAKRDFEAVKAARDPALQQKSGVPRIVMPDFHPVAPASAGAWAPLKQPETLDKKSQNWLVEAMDKPADSRKDPRGRHTSERDRGGDVIERESGSSRKDPSRDAIEKADSPTDSRDRKDSVVVTNPLTRYLGDWMTPQDYALLKPGLEQSLAGTGSPQTTRGDAALGSTTALGAIETTFVSAGLNVPAGAAAPARRENPYLEVLNSPSAPPPTVFASPAPPAPAPAPTSRSAAVVAPLPPPSPAKSKIPDFVKPATDEKYFKQLKRF